MLASRAESLLRLKVRLAWHATRLQGLLEPGKGTAFAGHQVGGRKVIWSSDQKVFCRNLALCVHTLHTAVARCAFIYQAISLTICSFLSLEPRIWYMPVNGPMKTYYHLECISSDRLVSGLKRVASGRR